jgi:hypothetical protein
MNFKINHPITNCWSQPLNTSNRILSNGSKNVQQCSPCEMYRRESPIITCIYKTRSRSACVWDPHFRSLQETLLNNTVQNTSNPTRPWIEITLLPTSWDLCLVWLHHLFFFWFLAHRWLCFIMKDLLNENGIIISNFYI